MEYSLHNHSGRPDTAISKDEYEVLRASKVGLSHVINVERIFDVVMENYVELEETVMSLSVRQIAFHIHSHTEFQAMRELISRRILNFLSSARLYRDTLKKHAKQVLSANDLQKIEAMLADGSHQPMEYRIVAELRDFAQHEDLPLSGMTISRGWEDDEGKAKGSAYVSVIPRMDTQRLANRRDIAIDVRAALNAMGPNADVRNQIRKYIEYLGSIHDTFRKLIKKSAADWEDAIRQTMTRYREALIANEKAFVVVARGKDDKGDSESIQLFDEFFEHYRYLKNKNLSQANLSRYNVQWQSKDQLANKGKTKKP